MNIRELYEELTEAYSGTNLNLITGKLILLYKRKNYGAIREIANKVSKYIPIDEEQDAKCFSRLMMLYHPDKGEQMRNAVKSHYEKNEFEKLNIYSHILLLKNIDSFVVSQTEENIEFRSEYVWEQGEADRYRYTNSDEYDFSKSEPDSERSFYNLIKIREYGNVHIEFPTYYLEDFEEFELAYSGLESLDGVEYCKHVKILDVSDNELSDLENLWDLVSLEELYLANNRIGYIDSLSNLPNLRIVDISGNDISDITPLFELENLEYVNLIGNTVPDDQILRLREMGVIVMI